MGSVIDFLGLSSSRPASDRTISCLLSPMLYILMLMHFFRKLKANPIQHGITPIPTAITAARYCAYTDDVTAFDESNAEIDEVGKEIRRFETVTGVKIIRDESVALRLGGCSGVSSRILHLDGKASQDTRYLVWPRHPVEIELVRSPGKTKLQFICGSESGI